MHAKDGNFRRVVSAGESLSTGVKNSPLPKIGMKEIRLELPFDCVNIQNRLEPIKIRPKGNINVVKRVGMKPSRLPTGSLAATAAFPAGI